MSTPTQQFDVERILKLVRPDGHLSKMIRGFEYRPQQEKMMSNIIEAYQNNQITLIEAGTGTGKSLSYLIPALVWATLYKDRTVISTHTIALQEQLVNKDLPHLIKSLNLKLKFVLVKGMNNYICLRKLKDSQAEFSLIHTEESREIEQIHALSENLKEGSRSELPFLPSPTTWDQVGAESEACTHSECPYYQQCFFFKARRQAQDAQILVANHSLLMFDLANRAETGNYSEPAIFPSYKRVIIDEAHHLEGMATEHFALRLHRLELMRILGRLASEKQSKAHGKLPMLKDKLQNVYNKAPPTEVASIIQKISIDLHALRLALNDQIHHTFECLHHFMEGVKQQPELVAQEEMKLRLLNSHYTHPLWLNGAVPEIQKLSSLLKEYRHDIWSIDETLKKIDYVPLQEQTKGIRIDIQGLLLRIDEIAVLLGQFLAPQPDPNKVRWIESQKMKTLTNIHLVDADLDVSKILNEFLFSKFSTVVLCSATLTTNQQFDFFKRRLGLTPELLKQRISTENIYESSFNYQKQVMFGIPTDIPLPNDDNFNQISQEHIWRAVEASQGNAFVLFTSYTMLNQCYDALAERCKEKGFALMKQGDANRHALLSQFKNTDKSILLGTSSFWEGVDVAGDALRCVIIVKLPFQVPSEPIVQARTEAIESAGGNPFLEYSVPEAIVRFKQGFGRLIRNKWDRGCVICLDTRLIQKQYGKLFLDSLPECQRVFAPGTVLYPAMREFYRKTYYLVKQNPLTN